MRLVITQNITLDGVIEAIDNWFAPASGGQDMSDIEAELRRLCAGAFQHFLLALIIARGHGMLDLVCTDVGDDALPRGDQLDDLAVHLGQPPPQFFERHRGFSG